MKIVPDYTMVKISNAPVVKIVASTTKQSNYLNVQELMCDRIDSTTFTGTKNTNLYT